MGGNRSDEKKPNLKSKKERKKGITECEPWKESKEYLEDVGDEVAKEIGR